MSALLFAGFFREIRHGHPEGPSLRASLAPEPHRDEERIVSYLEHGTHLAVTGSLATDVLRDDSKPIVALGTLTDGVWIWPSDLPYYVATYHARVPDELIARAASLGWVPPQLDHKALGEITERLFDADTEAPG